MDFSKSDITDIPFKGCSLNGCKFRKGDLKIEHIREAKSAIGIIEVDENGVETPHPDACKCIRQRNTELPHQILQGIRGYTSEPISKLSFDPPAIYIRTVGGWWAKVSETEHRPVMVIRGRDWYETPAAVEVFDPRETVKVIL